MQRTRQIQDFINSNSFYLWILIMKVLIINGSPRKDGNTSIAIREMVKIFEKERIDAEVFQVGAEAVRGLYYKKPNEKNS